MHSIFINTPFDIISFHILTLNVAVNMTFDAFIIIIKTIRPKDILIMNYNRFQR